MSEDVFDAIIVGAGLSGCVAALVLAREGANVLVIERGNHAGAKNVTGGRLYGHSLERIIPDFAAHAPVERRITREKYRFLPTTAQSRWITTMPMRPNRRRIPIRFCAVNSILG